MPYDAALSRAASAYQEVRCCCCDIHTSNAQFNDWIHRSLADLLMMTTETPRDLVRAVRAGSISLPPASAVAPTPVAKPAVAIPERAATLVDVLRWHANTHPLRTHLTLLVETEEGPREEPINYRELHDEAARAAQLVVRSGHARERTHALR